MKVIADRIVLFTNKSGEEYVWNPVISVDHDLIVAI